MKRIRTAPVLLTFSVVVGIFLFLFLGNSGVREIRRTAKSNGIALAEIRPGFHDWPWWRGTNHDNSVSTVSPPLKWSNSENVAWKVEVPGRGHSSPCLWSDRIFLSTSETNPQTISLLCYECHSGRVLWQKELHRGGFMPLHEKNSHASSTPACDGHYVYVANSIDGRIWMDAIDFDGRIAWRCDVGPYASEWGYASSAVIHDTTVIVMADNRGSHIDRLIGSSWLAAIHRQTGEVIWRIKRTEGDSFGSPTVATIAGREQLVVSGKGSVSSYDPRTGDLLWKCRWGIERTANTVAFDDRCVYASGRHPNGEIVCIRADGQGDVTETHVQWREKKSACDVPSPCVRDGCFYSLGDDGILSCLNTADGKLTWKRRLGGNMSSSPLIAGEHMFCCNEDGQTFVVRLGGRGEIDAENSLNEGIMASPIVSADRIFLRTLSHLYCLAVTNTAPIASTAE